MRSPSPTRRAAVAERGHPSGGAPGNEETQRRREQQDHHQRHAEAVEDAGQDHRQQAIELVFLFHRRAQRQEVGVDLARDPEGQLQNAWIAARLAGGPRQRDEVGGRLACLGEHRRRRRPLVDDPRARENSRVQKIRHVGQITGVVDRAGGDLCCSRVEAVLHLLEVGLVDFDRAAQRFADRPLVLVGDRLDAADGHRHEVGGRAERERGDGEEREQDLPLEAAGQTQQLHQRDLPDCGRGAGGAGGGETTPSTNGCETKRT